MCVRRTVQNHAVGIKFETSEATEPAAEVTDATAAVASPTALVTSLATLPATLVASDTTLPTTLVASDTTLPATLVTSDTTLPTADVTPETTLPTSEVMAETMEEPAERSVDTAPVTFALVLLPSRIDCISEIDRDNPYVVGTSVCFDCNHGTSYPPTPIWTVSALAMSRYPKGMIPNDASAPFVRRTLPKVPLFAVPLAGTTKLSNAWSK